MSKISVTWIVPQNSKVPCGIYLLEQRKIPDHKWAEAEKLTTKYLEELQSLSSKWFYTVK